MSSVEQPRTESRIRKGWTRSRFPYAHSVACPSCSSHISASRPCKLLTSTASGPSLSSSATGCLIPGATSFAATANAVPAAGPVPPPINAATSSRRAATPPTSTHSGNLSSCSLTPSTSETFSRFWRTALRAHGMERVVDIIRVPVRAFFSGRPPAPPLGCGWIWPLASKCEVGVKPCRAGVGELLSSTLTFLFAGGTVLWCCRICCCCCCCCCDCCRCICICACTRCCICCCACGCTCACTMGCTCG
mmetsp:Transcript_73898/g.205452  ORF Transcript_73898/g.205452 Transcript_73898/m.205452 type:complete len:248 (+) Transcript_73898:2021-2764(+)